MKIEKLSLIHNIEGISVSERVDSFGNDAIKMMIDQLGEIGDRDEKLSEERIVTIKQQMVSEFVSVASDLGTLGLAEGHVDRLINHLLEQGAETELDLLVGGAVEFYNVTKNVLGPLWAGYVDTIFSSGKGKETYLFAARDATPMYWTANGLLDSGDEKYNLAGSRLVHVDWNRWFMGQEDETDEGEKPIPWDDPMLTTFYKQMGFGNGRLVKIVEPGAWGSAANALKTIMPEQPFELWFMFSHMPERIYGYLNECSPSTEEKHLEMISDTAEAVPKSYLRPTVLVKQNGHVVADLNGKVLPSPYMRLWSWAANQGAFDAGVLFSQGKKVKIDEQIKQIIELSSLSAQNFWTGVLPRNTMTWTGGDAWRESWKWGKIPPLD